MPAMYPEELRRLREQNPGLQYDFRGNVIGAAQPDSVQMAADAIYQMPGVQQDAWSFGPTRADFQNSKDFIGPVQPQWWDPNGELNQMGGGMLDGFMAGRDLQPRRAARPSYGAPLAQTPYAPRQRGFDASGDAYEPQSSAPALAPQPSEYPEIPEPDYVQAAADSVRGLADYMRPYMPLRDQDMRAYRLLGGNPEVGRGTNRNPINRFLDWTRGFF